MEPTPAAAKEAASPAGGSGRFVVGDAIRAVAALTVVVYHCAYFTGDFKEFNLVYDRPLAFILNGGDLGLWVFFALSGYLVAKPFVAAYVRGAPGPGVVRYVRNRLVRIVPLFWVILTVVLVGHLLANDVYGVASRRDGVGPIIAVYAFAQNYWNSSTSQLVGSAWTLDLEVVFYASLPVIGALVLRRRRGPANPAARTRRVLVACVVVAAGSVAFRQWVPHTLSWSRAFPGLAIGFVPGIALAAIEPYAMPWLAARRDLGRWLPWLMLGGAVVAAVLYQLVAPDRFGYEPRNPAVRVVPAALFGGAILAAPLIRQWAGAAPWRVLDNGPMRWLGQCSYGIYLWHQAVIYQLLTTRVGHISGHTERFAIMVLLVVPTTTALASITYRLVEVPFLRLRSGVSRGSFGPDQSDAARS